MKDYNVKVSTVPGLLIVQMAEGLTPLQMFEVGVSACVVAAVENGVALPDVVKSFGEMIKEVQMRKIMTEQKPMEGA